LVKNRSSINLLPWAW